MTANKYHQFNPEELVTLAYLKNMREYIPESFANLIVFGAKATEMIRFIEHPEKYDKFDFVFVCGLFESIKKTYQKYVLMEFPKIGNQNQGDKILCMLLSNDTNYSLLPVDFLNPMISTAHLIAYLERNKLIYKWNACLATVVKQEVIKVKKYLNYKLYRTS